jgi:hypothetical protein
MNFLSRICLTAVASFGSALASAGTITPVVTESVPTLDEWGLIGLMAAIGVVGGLAIRKRNKKK